MNVYLRTYEIGTWAFYVFLVTVCEMCTWVLLNAKRGYFLCDVYLCILRAIHRYFICNVDLDVLYVYLGTFMGNEYLSIFMCNLCRYISKYNVHFSRFMR